MNTTTDRPQYLVCEQKWVYVLLMAAAGMMGAYTFNLRGGVFCNAQTANFVMMAVAFGQGRWMNACYYLIPVFAYLSGAFLSEILPSPVKRLGFLRWDTYLIGFEILVLFVIGLIPLSWPDHLVQVLVNFIASMQYNTFRQARGIPMATTFCTNHLRQIGIALAKLLRKGDRSMIQREAAHAAEGESYLAGPCPSGHSLYHYDPCGPYHGARISWRQAFRPLTAAKGQRFGLRTAGSSVRPCPVRRLYAETLLHGSLLLFRPGCFFDHSAR